MTRQNYAGKLLGIKRPSVNQNGLLANPVKVGDAKLEGLRIKPCQPDARQKCLILVPPFFALVSIHTRKHKMKTIDFKIKSNMRLACFLTLSLSACGGSTSTTGASGINAGAAVVQGIATPASHSVPLNNMDYQAIRALAGTGIGGTLSPADLQMHYNLPAVSKLSGTNQTIAIVDAPGSGNIANDLNTFSSYYQLPVCNTSNTCFQKIDLSNGAKVSPSNDWAVEIGLDVEWAHAMAPSAKILLVVAKSAAVGDLLVAVQTAASQPGVVAVSMSWGAGEYSSQTAAAYDGVFKSIQANGITLLASSGDAGDNGVNQSWPATSPYVTAVGGTSIKSAVASTAPSATGEVTWIGSGGGTSTIELMPSYQSALLTGSTVLKASKGKRVYPDVAYNADPNASPVGVYFNGGWYAVGGTSAGAPQWSAILALIANQRATAGKTTLQRLVASTAGGFNGVLYQAKLDSTALFDITAGTDNTGRTSCALCTATNGYDEATGLGVPNVNNLLSFF